MAKATSKKKSVVRKTRRRRPASRKSPRRLSFKRHIVQPAAKQAEMMALLRKQFRKRGFFKGLQKLNYRDGLRLFYFEGIPVLIKDTFGIARHGLDSARLRGEFLAHQKAVRNDLIKAEHYKLKSAKVYGKVGRYLIIEYVEGINPYFARKHMSERAFNSFKGAKFELEENFWELRAQRLLSKKLPHTSGIPQIDHLIIVGNSNLRAPTKGKWVFFLPYDYF